MQRRILGPASLGTCPGSAQETLKLQSNPSLSTDSHLSHSHDGTMKKSTMDVARLMLRTKSHKVIDDVFEEIINGKNFSLRIIEDSYGPMRIFIPSKTNHEGRDDSIVSSDEDDEQGFVEGDGLDGDDHDHGEEVREVERETVHPLTMIDFPNSNDKVNFDIDTVRDNLREGVIHNQSILREPSSHSVPVAGEVEKGLSNNSLILSSPLSNNAERETTVNNIGPSNNSPVLSSIVRSEPVGSVNNDVEVLGELGCVKLTEVQRKATVTSEPKRWAKSNYLEANKALAKGTRHDQNHPPLNGTGRNSSLASSDKNSSDNRATCTRNPVGKIKKPQIASNSLSLAGTILCCSSLQSSEIRNCNNVILKKRENEVTSKIWKGVRDLGIGGDEDEEECIRHIHNNEKRDEVGKIQREQQNKGVN